MLMRRLTIVTYDIADAKRLKTVYKLMRGYGDHLQLSVFVCELTPRELVELKSRLEEEIHHREDQVVFVDVGPAPDTPSQRITALGKRYAHPERLAVIV
jgi:CRISPR-associated protein Cas2